jgi:hypothetical protein
MIPYSSKGESDQADNSNVVATCYSDALLSSNKSTALLQYVIDLVTKFEYDDGAQCLIVQGSYNRIISSIFLNYVPSSL